MNIFFYVKLSFTLIFFITTCTAQDGAAWQKKHLPDGAAAAPQKKYLSVHIPTDTPPSALITSRVSPQTSPEDQPTQLHRMSISATSSASHTSSTASSPSHASKPPSATAATRAIFSPSQQEEYKMIIDRFKAEVAQEKEAHEKEKAALTKQNQELQAELAHLKISMQQRQRSHSRSSIPPRHSRTSSLSASSASSPSAEPGTPFVDLPGRNSPETDSSPPSPEEQIPFSQQSPHLGKRMPPTTSVLAAVTEEETNEQWLV